MQHDTGGLEMTPFELGLAFTLFSVAGFVFQVGVSRTGVCTCMHTHMHIIYLYQRLSRGRGVAILGRIDALSKEI